MRGRISLNKGYRLLVILLLLSACSPQQPSTPQQKQKTLTLWHAYRGDEALALKQNIELFQDQTGLTVRALQLPHQALNNKLQAAIPRGNGPDLWIAAHDRIGDYAQAGLIEPIGYWMTPSFSAQYFEQTLEALSYQGNLYGLPISFKTLVLYYRKDLTPTPPQTLEELKHMARQLRERGVRWGLAAPELDSLYFYAPWLHAYQGDALKLTSVATQEALLKSLEIVQSLLHEGFIPPELNGALTASLFQAGQLAFVINGPWFKGDLTDLKAPWSIAPLPTLNDKALTPYLGVEGIFISSHAHDPQAAWQLAQALTGAPAAHKALQQGILVAQKSPYQSQVAQSDEWRATFEAQLRHTKALSNEPKMKRLWTPFKRLLSSVLFYKASPNESLKEAIKAIEEQNE